MIDNNFLDWIKVLWPVLSLPVVWLFKEVNMLKKSYYETKIHAAETFVTKTEYREDLRSVEKKLDKILEKLDHKVDK